MKKTDILKFCFLSTLLPVAAWADDQTGGPPIVVTATRVPTPAAEVPAGVTVLTARDFRRQGDTTLAQALSAVPGLHLAQSGGPGNAASVFIRGTDSEDVLVLLDGVPVNDPSDPNGAFNFGTYSLEDIERIEIVRGPLSGLYGSNAIGGVINIITRRGTQPSQASVTLAGGWPAQGQASAAISGVAGRFDYALSGALDEEAGFDALPKRMSVFAGVRDPYRSKLGSAQFGYRVTPDTRVYVILRADHTDSGFPDLDDPIFDDPDEFDHNDELFGKLGLSTTMFDGRLSTDLFIARSQNRLLYSNLLDADDPNQASAHDLYRGARTDAQWNNRLRLPDTGLFSFSDLLFGAEYANDSARENVDEGSLYGPFTESVRAAQHFWAGHAGVQTTFANRLTLTGALRDDSVSSFGNALTWRVGAALAVPEAGLTLKSAYGTGFLAPSLFDLHYVDNYGDSGNPDLRPERSTGWEAGPEFDIPAFGRADFAQLSATYFSTSIRDLIQSELTPAYTYVEENVASAKIDGVETEYVITPANWFSADLSYTYTHARSAGTELLRRPRNVVSATMTITPLPGFSIVPQIEYTGRFYDYIYDDAGYPTGIGSSDPGTVVNLNASYRLDDQLTVFATGKNIFNSAFEPVNGLQIPGASLLIGVRATVE